jgi:hypothetical protein
MRASSKARDTRAREAAARKLRDKAVQQRIHNATAKLHVSAIKIQRAWRFLFRFRTTHRLIRNFMHPEFGQNFTRTKIMAEKMGYVCSKNY